MLFIVNFEPISHIFLKFIVNFEQANIWWVFKSLSNIYMEVFHLEELKIRLWCRGNM